MSSHPFDIQIAPLHKPVQILTENKIFIIFKKDLWAVSSIGRALPWHGRGSGFKSRTVHQSLFTA